MPIEIIPQARIGLKTEGQVAQISLNNPPLNVIDFPMMDELAAVFRELEARPEISSLVFRGEGEAFSAGVDIAAHTPDRIAETLEKFHGIIRGLIDTNRITIAAVHGKCLGGGAELAMMCDVVITAADATWGFPEITLGCYPPVAASALSALIGQKRAADLILTGTTILGTEASEIGLATRAVAPDLLESAVSEILTRLQRLSPAVLPIAKKAIYAWDSIHFDKGLARSEKIYLQELMKTEDAEEGVRAFLEKRNPAWKGR
jgi:cyclohexa-1,5-dienecarbonyl-CoA hydratase